MRKSVLFSVLVVGATLLQAQSITVHQTCGQNGQVVKTIPPEAVQAVDLGLSVKWANMNVGATTPEDYGNHYAWGETVPKETYNWSTYFDSNDSGDTFAKYKNEGGKTVLDPNDDAAHVNWGGSWRMPTKAECLELLENCTWRWTTRNGINGYKVTSNKAGYTDKFIFLPVAGYRDESGLYNVGSYGYYWSSSLGDYNSDYAWYMNFRSGDHGLYCDDRNGGHSVRPVLLPSSTSYGSSANDTIRIYSNGCDDYQTFIGSHGGQLTMSAQSDQWSHFVRWNDGNTDNPRTITTNGNADYTAYFETYRYSVQVQSNDAARGRGYISKVVKEETIEYNESVGTFDAGSKVYLSSQPNYGYHFTQWSDGVTDNPRMIELTQDTILTALFDSIPAGQGTTATEIKNDSVTVSATPTEDNSVILEWPAVESADTYTIAIYKNDELICTLVFDAEGHLISIRFAAPARDCNGRNIPVAEQAANGWRYVVNGIEGNATYTYSVVAQDENGNVLLSESIDFTMPVPLNVDNIDSSSLQGGNRGRLILRDGQVLILRGEKEYTLTGQEVR